MVVTVDVAYKEMTAASPFSGGVLASEHSTWKPETPIFRQWTGADEHGIQTANRAPDELVDVPEGHKWGYVAQWFYLLGDRGLYVNLPGMQHGSLPIGGVFEIGSERVYSDTPPEELENLVEVGYRKLMELIEAEKAKAV